MVRFNILPSCLLWCCWKVWDQSNSYPFLDDLPLDNSFFSLFYMKFNCNLLIPSPFPILLELLSPLVKGLISFPFFLGNSQSLVSQIFPLSPLLIVFFSFGIFFFFHMDTDQITLFCTLLSFYFFFFFLLSVCSSGLQSIWIVVWLTNWFFNWIHLAIQPIYWDFFQLLYSVFSEFPFGFMTSYFTSCFQYSPLPCGSIWYNNWTSYV